MDRGELGRVAFLEANFSNERALELTPKTWRWYKDRAPGGPLSQLAIHHFDVLHYLGGDIVEASSMASKLSPVGAEVDDQSMTLLKFADGKIGYVGSCWTSPGVFSVRVFGSKGLMHYEIDFGSWDTPDKLHETLRSTFSGARRATQARGAEGSGKRHVPYRVGNVRGELPHGQADELTAENGYIAVAVVYPHCARSKRTANWFAIADMISRSPCDESTAMSGLCLAAISSISRSRRSPRNSKNPAGHPASRQRGAAWAASADGHRHFRGERHRPRRRGTHGRACLTWGPARCDAVSYAVRGHISLTPHTYMRLVAETCASTASHGAKYLLILNWHEGNIPSLAIAADALHREHGMTVPTVQACYVAEEISAPAED